MGFMKLYTQHGHWQIIRNTRDGDICTFEQDAEFRGNEAAAKAYGVDPEDVETVFGWCAHYSAPGYMDQTDWCGPYETEEEAIAECKEMYGREDEDEDDA